MVCLTVKSPFTGPVTFSICFSCGFWGCYLILKLITVRGKADVQLLYSDSWDVVNIGNMVQLSEQLQGLQSASLHL